MKAACFGAVALAATLNLSCVAVPDYTCHDNTSCVRGDGAQGLCEMNNQCSFPDNGCPTTLRRYGDGASAGSCVQPGSSCVLQLAMGSQHSCAVRSDGAVFCWGANDQGQVGDGTMIAQPTPTQVMGLPANAVMVSASETHSCALLTDNSVWCWGGNSALELGTGAANPVVASVVPVRVKTSTGSAADGGTPTLVDFNATQISSGGAHTCAVGLDEKAYCWGENQSGSHGGQCGQDPAAFDDVPFATAVAGLDGVVQIGSGDEFTCARKDDKTVYCWGANSEGELGVGAGPDSYTPYNVSAVPSVAQLATGDESACVLKDDSSVWCWGYGGQGSIGNGQTNDSPLPVRVGVADKLAAGGTAFVFCSIDTMGGMSCWGDNTHGQTGTGSTSNTLSSPTAVAISGVAQAATGDDHSCAVTVDGQLFCWGDNMEGELGLKRVGPQQSIPQRVAFPCP